MISEKYVAYLLEHIGPDGKFDQQCAGVNTARPDSLAILQGLKEVPFLQQVSVEDKTQEDLRYKRKVPMYLNTTL